MADAGYAVFDRLWCGGDVIELDLPMGAGRLYAGHSSRLPGTVILRNSASQATLDSWTGRLYRTAVPPSRER